MFKKKILIVILSLILAVIISGASTENSEADNTSKTKNNDPQRSTDTKLNKDANSKNTDTGNGSPTIAIKVPPEMKHGTPRPMLFIFNAPKTNTSNAPTETKGQDTVAMKVPPVEKDKSPRPMLFVDSNNKPTKAASTPNRPPKTKPNTVAPAKNDPTIALMVPPVEKGGTPRPMLFLFPKHNTTTTTNEAPKPKTVAPKPKTVAPKPKTVAPTPPTESIGPKGNNPLVVAIKVPPGEEGGTPRPILFIYSPDNTTKISPPSAARKPSDNAVPTSPVAPNVSNKSPGTCPVENNGKPYPMSWIIPDTPTSPDGSSKRPINLLRGYNCPKRNGFFRYPDKCDVYIICKDYIPLTYICPEGLQFNANAQKHELLCAPPSVAKCGNEPVVPQKTDKNAVDKKPAPAKKDGEPHPILFIESRGTTPRPETSTDLPSNVLRGYSCPKRNGLFSYPGKCDVYIMCEDYTPLTYICPDGLQFNPRARRPDHVCDDPSVVKCGMDEPGRETIRPTQRHKVTRPTPAARLPWSNIHRFSCPTPNGYFRFTEQCDEYVECRVYTPLRYICPEGLHFDPDARWTEYPCVDPSLARCNGP